jgi:hypothetical protein
MPSRQSWPRGLKALFWLAVIGLLVGIGQTVYWAVVTQEFFPQLTIQGGYAALALLLTVACVAFGALGYRRPFAVTSLVTAVFHIGVTAFFNLDIFRLWLPDIVAGRWQPLLSWEVNSWIYVWNSFEIAVNALVCYYLLRYEFRFFGFTTA